MAVPGYPLGYDSTSPGLASGYPRELFSKGAFSRVSRISVYPRIHPGTTQRNQVLHPAPPEDQRSTLVPFHEHPLKHSYPPMHLALIA